MDLDTADRFIKPQYEEIKEQCDGATLYGEPVNTEDMEQLVVAAYHLGVKEGEGLYDVPILAGMGWTRS